MAAFKCVVIQLEGRPEGPAYNGVRKGVNRRTVLNGRPNALKNYVGRLVE